MADGGDAATIFLSTDGFDQTCCFEFRTKQYFVSFTSENNCIQYDVHMRHGYPACMSLACRGQQETYTDMGTQ